MIKQRDAVLAEKNTKLSELASEKDAKIDELETKVSARRAAWIREGQDGGR